MENNEWVRAIVRLIVILFFGGVVLVSSGYDSSGVPQVVRIVIGIGLASVGYVIVAGVERNL